MRNLIHAVVYNTMSVGVIIQISGSFYTATVNNYRLFTGRCSSICESMQLRYAIHSQLTLALNKQPNYQSCASLAMYTSCVAGWQMKKCPEKKCVFLKRVYTPGKLCSKSVLGNVKPAHARHERSYILWPRGATPSREEVPV